MDRRTFLKATLTTSALAAFGPAQWALAQREARDLVVVSSSGGGGSGPLISLLDPEALEVIATLPLAGAFSFPATRWGFDRDVIWSGLPAGPNDAVNGFRLSTGEQVAAFPTGSDQNYTELTPDGRRLVVAARFEDAFYVLGADPDRDDFGAELAHVVTYDGASPCDITIHPEGTYAYAPDRGGDTLSVLRVEPLEVLVSIPMESAGDGPLEPYMATVSPTGETLLVENAVVPNGSSTGSESIFDLSDPARPVEVARFGPEEGMGRAPLTSEITPDGQYGLVVCRDSDEVTVLDLGLRQIVARVALPDGSRPFTGTFVFGDGNGDRFFVPLPGRDAVAAISVPDFEVLALIPVGARPQGAVYLHAPVPDRAAAAVPLGVALGAGRTFPDGCPDPCCGPV